MFIIPTYFIIEDDASARKMLENIIEDCSLGEVIGSSTGGMEAVSSVLVAKPEVVLIDLLMPELDGIAIIQELKKREFKGRFIMISQISNKDLVGEAYAMGIEFFIHKPINRLEVEAVLRKINKQITLKQSLTSIKDSLAQIEGIAPALAQNKMEPNVRGIVQSILMDIGILGEKGSQDMVLAIKAIVQNNMEFPSLKKIYELVAFSYKKGDKQVRPNEVKAIEQRIRRAVHVALANLASLGLTDYSHPKFEYYAPLFFDFQDIRLKMNELEKEQEHSTVKINVRKFLKVLYLETVEKLTIK